MHKYSEEFRITSMSRVLGVSRSGFYRWRQRGDQPTKRQQQRMALDKLVADAFFARKMRSGSPRLTLDLRDQGYRYDRKTVAASMKRQSLRARAARKYKATTNSKHTLAVAPNLLAQDFSAKAPNQKWVSDITYLWTDEGWVYLAVIIDLYSRLVVGWALAERMTADLVCQALQMALWRRKNPKGVLLHSDRGGQYCSTSYRALLTKHQLVCSMRGKGNCYDNGAPRTP